MIAILKNCFVNGEKSSDSITQSAFLIAVMGVASRALGLFRDRILAAKYGAGDELDIYYAAFKIPDLIYTFLVLGALSAAFIPVFSFLITKKKEREAWEFTNSILSIGIFLLGIIAISLYFLAPFFVKLIVFGFNQRKQTAVVELTRIMLLSPVILGISGIAGGILNSFKKFFFYSLAPVFYNIGIIIGAIFFTSFWGIKGLALGVVLGSLLHLLIQIPEIIRSGFRFNFCFDFKNQYLHQVGKLMIPRLMGLAVSQINLLVITILASTLESGSLAVFNFANNLQSIPIGLFSISYAVAAFPALSCIWAQGDKKEFAEKFSKTFRRILFFVIPLSIFIFLLRAQIVRLILGTGKFSWEDTVATLNVLGIFCVSLFAQGMIPFLTRAFYSTQDTKTPFFVGIFVETINIILALILIGKMGLSGLVWAFSISSIINAFLLFLIFGTKTSQLNKKIKEIIYSVFKVIFASLLAGIFIQILKYFIGVDPFGPERTLVGILTQFLVSFLGGLVVYGLVGKLLKIEEVNYFARIVKRKIFLRKSFSENFRDETGGI